MEINLTKFFNKDEIFIEIKDGKRGKLSLLKDAYPNINDVIKSVRIGRFGKYLSIPLTFNITNDWLYISELIRTDGHVSANFLETKLTNNDMELLKKFEEFCRSLGINYIRKEKDRYRVFNKTLSLILNKIFEIQAGNKSLNIYLPKLIKSLDNPLLSFTLRGAFDGDGTVQNSKDGTRRIRLNTGSKRYAEDIQECLLEFDINSSVFKDPREGKNVWYVEISDKVSLTRFRQEIGFLQLKRAKKLNELLETYSSYPIEEFKAIVEDLLQVNNKMTITQIAKTVNRSLSTVSDQIIKLENSGIVKTERVGNKKFVKLS